MPAQPSAELGEIWVFLSRVECPVKRFKTDSLFECEVFSSAAFSDIIGLLHGPPEFLFVW